jgi:hypothetical protein
MELNRAEVFGVDGDIEQIARGFILEAKQADAP